MLKNIIVLILICIKILSLYNNSFPKEEYDYLSHKIAFSNLLLMDKDEYQVLFYLESCPNCSLTLEIINKRKLYQYTNIYYIDILEVDERNKITTINNVGISNYEEVQVNVVPLLFDIRKKIIAQKIGKDQIIDYLELMT